METLTQKLNELSPSTTKLNKVAAYSEPPKDYQHQLDKLTKLMKLMESHLLNQMASLDRRVDARFNGLAQRRQAT